MPKYVKVQVFDPMKDGYESAWVDGDAVRMIAPGPAADVAMVMIDGLGPVGIKGTVEQVVKAILTGTLIGIGNGWTTEDNGKTIVREDGKKGKLNNGTAAGRLVANLMDQPEFQNALRDRYRRKIAAILTGTLSL